MERAREVRRTNRLLDFAKEDDGFASAVLEVARSPWDQEEEGRDQSAEGGELGALVLPTGEWLDLLGRFHTPDEAFRRARTVGEPRSWIQGIPVRGDEMRLLLPNESSPTPLAMFFGFARVATHNVSGEAVGYRDVLDFWATELPMHLDRRELAVQIASRAGEFFGRFRRFRRQTCRSRKDLEGCVSNGCAGVCKPYWVPEGGADWLVCTCVLS